MQQPCSWVKNNAGCWAGSSSSSHIPTEHVTLVLWLQLTVFGLYVIHHCLLGDQGPSKMQDWKTMDQTFGIVHFSNPEVLVSLYTHVSQTVVAYMPAYTVISGWRLHLQKCENSQQNKVKMATVHLFFLQHIGFAQYLHSIHMPRIFLLH